MHWIGYLKYKNCIQNQDNSFKVSRTNSSMKKGGEIRRQTIEGLNTAEVKIYKKMYAC